MLNFYDFEVFKHDWLVVIINPVHKTKEVIVNDRERLLDYWHKHKHEIWIGWNSSRYDKIILKAIILGFNPKSTNDCIIQQNLSEWQIDSSMKQITVLDYDVKFDRSIGLKQVEGFMGNDIEETSVPFNIDRKLTDEEIERTIKYCTHDVEQTMEIFLLKQDDFNAHMSLIKEFNLPLDCISMTKARLASTILKSRKKNFRDDWEIEVPKNIVLGKYKFVSDWFLDRKNHYDDSKLECEIAGVPHSIGWGGLHGAIKNYNHTCNDDELLIMADVDQQYPTIMVKYDLLSRGAKDKDKYKFILDKSLKLKAEGNKEERKPYKDMNNITYGAMGDEFNGLYDPLHRKLVCVYGQLLLIDLIEEIEGFAKIIQSNTDGLMIKIKADDFELLDDIVYSWEKRTGLKMSFDFYKKIIQKDVNNYIAVDFDGGLKRKGGYVKELSELDNDLPIVNEAVVRFLVDGISPEKTVNECNDFIKFQKIVKLSKLYKNAYHNGKQLSGSVFRVFASRDLQDGQIMKQKETWGNKEKFANTPAKCFIENGEVKGKKVPFKLDRWWYIELAEKRIADFGLDARTVVQQELF